MNTITGLPSPEMLAILKALQDAVTKELERKRRLGHYAVIWQDGRPVLLGGEHDPARPVRIA